MDAFAPTWATAVHFLLRRPFLAYLAPVSWAPSATIFPRRLGSDWVKSTMHDASFRVLDG